MKEMQKKTIDRKRGIERMIGEIAKDDKALADCLQMKDGKLEATVNGETFTYDPALHCWQDGAATKRGITSAFIRFVKERRG